MKMTDALIEHKKKKNIIYQKEHMDLRDIILSEGLRTCQPQLWTWDVWHISMPVKVKCSCEINMPQGISILWKAAVNSDNYEIKISHISFNSELEMIRFSCNFNTCQVQRINRHRSRISQWREDSFLSGLFVFLFCFCFCLFLSFYKKHVFEE